MWLYLGIWVLGIICKSFFDHYLAESAKGVASVVSIVLGTATIPKVEICAATPANQASEDFMELIHLEVRNVGFNLASTKKAKNASIKVYIDRNYELRFQAQGKPRLRVDLDSEKSRKKFKDKPYFVPLVARSNGKNAVYDNKLLLSNIIYVMDNPFWEANMTESTLSPGRYDVKAVVNYDEQQRDGAIALFELIIPDDGKIEIMRRSWSWR